jgi:hypothetical protein
MAKLRKHVPVGAEGEAELEAESGLTAEDWSKKF